MENCVAQNLKYLRATHLITLQALAEILVIEPRYVEALEDVDSYGLYDLKSVEEDERLSKLCTYFNVSLGHLLFENMEEVEKKRINKTSAKKAIAPYKNVFKKTSALIQKVANLQAHYNMYMNKTKMIRE